MEKSEAEKKYDRQQDRKWIVFIFSFPALAVIAGLITLTIAITHPDPEVDKTVNRFGLTPIVEEKLGNANGPVRESE